MGNGGGVICVKCGLKALLHLVYFSKDLTFKGESYVIFFALGEIKQCFEIWFCVVFEGVGECVFCRLIFLGEV
jgi:hypothetical protein